MHESVLKAVITVLFVYALIPTIIARLFSVNNTRRLESHKDAVAITFDDGPDPYCTPKVLDILKKYDVKAFFFILGSQAEKYPELVKRISEEGHEVAVHGYRHHVLWFLGPRGMKREIKDTMSVIEKITGARPRMFRPPWGLFNLLSFLNLCMYGQRMVLWTFMSWDWAKRSTMESISTRVLSKVKGGEILIFHDNEKIFGTAPGSGEKMLQALPKILEGLKTRGLRTVRPMEIKFKTGGGLVKSTVKSLWRVWELVFQKLWGLEEVQLNGEKTIFRVALKRYHGKELCLPDGTRIFPGDEIIELHFNNKTVLETTSDKTDSVSKGVSILREAMHSLPILAQWIKNNPRYSGAKAFMALTLMHRGTKKLGFVSLEPPRLLAFLTRLYEGWLLVLYHQEGLQRFSGHKNKLFAKQIVISKQELFKRYLTKNKDGDP